MSGRRRGKKTGTAILMAVMLVVLLGMIGMSFVVIAFLDRAEARSLAVSAPTRRAAMGTLDLARATLVDDLRFYTYPEIQGGKQSKFPYEACQIGSSWLAQVDCDSEVTDPPLASPEWQPRPVSNDPPFDFYPHVTNLFPGLLAAQHGRDALWERACFTNVPALPYQGSPVRYAFLNDGVAVELWLVDTDGDKVTDSILVDSGVRDADGNPYFVAVRIIDLGGRINVNTVFQPAAPVPFSTSPDRRGINQTDMDWGGLGFKFTAYGLHRLRCRIQPGFPLVGIWDYHNEFVRCPRHVQPDPDAKPPRYYPFYGQDDALALLWRESDWNSATYTIRGRLRMLFEGAGEYQRFVSDRRYLTTRSVSRLLPLQIASQLPPQPDEPAGHQYSQFPMDKRVDLNEILEIERMPSGQPRTDRYNRFFQDLGRAFFNAIPRGLANFTDGATSAQDMKRLILATQMACNVIDFADGDDEPTIRPAGGMSVCGVERQPFITELFLKKFKETRDSGIKQYSAIELYNPYFSPISLTDYRLKVDGNVQGGQWGINALGPRQRLVLRSHGDSDIPVRTGTPSVTIQELDLRRECEIVRQVSGREVHIGRGLIDDQKLPDPDPETDPADTVAYMVAQRDDRDAFARYSVAVYHDITRASAGEAPNYEHDYTKNGEGGSGNRTADNTNLGAANFTGLTDQGMPPELIAVAPTPVYVRNGGFINIGDLLRLYYLGPGQGPLDEQLAVDRTNLANGRWDARPGDTVSYTWDGKPWPDHVPQIPVACLFSEFFTVMNPAADKIDNDQFYKDPVTGQYVADDEYEKAVDGLLNINTASEQALNCLPFVKGVPGLPAAIVAYREQKRQDHPDQPAFATSGEILIPIRKLAASAKNTYGPNYRVADGGSSDDGLGYYDPATQAFIPVADDLAKHQIIYSRLSNLVTVRSDVFAVYITVVRFNGSTYDKDPSDLAVLPQAASRFLAILDRSLCYKRGDWPEVVLFTRMD